VSETYQSELEDIDRPSGPVAAAVLATGIGIFALGLLTTLSEASTGFSDFLASRPLHSAARHERAPAFCFRRRLGLARLLVMPKPFHSGRSDSVGCSASYHSRDHGNRRS
jgi:hypothetical protein